MNSLHIPLRIVFYREEDRWISHCLEFDLMGDGATPEEAMDRMTEALRLQVESSLECDNPANLFKPADGKFFAMFAAGKTVAYGELHLKFDKFVIDEAETREYVEGDMGLDSDKSLAFA